MVLFSHGTGITARKIEGAAITLPQRIDRRIGICPNSMEGARHDPTQVRAAADLAVFFTAR